MQIFYLPEPLMILSFFAAWPLLHLAAGVICRKIPNGRYKSGRGLYKVCSWESRAFYDRYFHVASWKKYLPDGAAILGNGFHKKHLAGKDPAYLELFLVESCRAELTHWLAIAPFWIFGLWAPARVIFWMLLYAGFVNLPCIMVQRYNRPRIAALIEKMGKRGMANEKSG